MSHDLSLQDTPSPDSFKELRIINRRPGSSSPSLGGSTLKKMATRFEGQPDISDLPSLKVLLSVHDQHQVTSNTNLTASLDTVNILQK